MEERQARTRRGILAAAGAVVAGILATRTSQPVGATTANVFISTGAGASNGDFDAQGSASYGFRAIDGTFQYGVYGTGTSFGVVGNSSTGTGVSGGSTSGTAVFGLTASATLASVEGRNLTGGGPGVLGSVYSTNTLANTMAVQGLNQSTGANGIGVVGQCDSMTGIGVKGASNLGVGVFGASNGNAGVLGITTAPGNAGLGGIANVAGTAAFAGTSTNPNAFAGFFTGDVFVNGNFTVQDPTRKHGAIQHPDGSLRLLYSMESPESWLEDFGTGQLVNGTATIALDPDFAAIVQTQEYHVFPVPHDPACKGLAVTARTAASFTVQEVSGGTSGGTFSYRVVARPKTEHKATRLAKFTVPDIKLPNAPNFSVVPAAPRVSDTPQSPVPPPPTGLRGSAPANAPPPTQSPVQPIPPSRST